ncbi:MAG: ParB/RepB/Spo0J family partition protein [Candidatus Geothermarchaeales archaeon]
MSRLAKESKEVLRDYGGVYKKIPTIDNQVKIKKFRYMPIKSLRAPNFPVRSHMGNEAMDELIHSIRLHGVLEPILVAKDGGEYVVIAGHRRYTAAFRAGLTQIPVVEVEVDDTERLMLSLTENLIREKIGAISEAKAFKELHDKHNVSYFFIADALGKSKQYVSNRIRLLNLDEEVMDYIESEALTPDHGLALLRIADKKIQRVTARRAVRENATVRRTRELVEQQLSLLKTSKGGLGGPGEESTSKRRCSICGDLAPKNEIAYRAICDVCHTEILKAKGKA